MKPGPVFFAAAACLALCLVPGASSAATYSSRALIENARLLDGKRVTYRGEAVTAVMVRGPMAWMNVNDGENAIGVWVRAGDASAVKVLGDYKHTGDTVEVEGLFSRACNEHGGELDIHADRVRVLRAGFARKEAFDGRMAGLAAFLFALVLGAVIAFRKKI